MMKKKDFLEVIEEANDEGLFTLKAKQKANGKYGLWIEPKSKETATYDYQKAVQSIHTFNLNANRHYKTGIDRSRVRQVTKRYYLVEGLLKARNAYIKNKSTATQKTLKEEIEQLKTKGYLTLVKMILGI